MKRLTVSEFKARVAAIPVELDKATFCCCQFHGHDAGDQLKVSVDSMGTVCLFPGEPLTISGPQVVVG